MKHVVTRFFYTAILQNWIRSNVAICWRILLFTTRFVLVCVNRDRITVAIFTPQQNICFTHRDGNSSVPQFFINIDYFLDYLFSLFSHIAVPTYVDFLVRNSLFAAECACIIFLFLTVSFVCEYYTDCSGVVGRFLLLHLRIFFLFQYFSFWLLIILYLNMYISLHYILVLLYFLTFLWLLNCLCVSISAQTIVQQ
jgi:hypothetical protein